MRDRVAAICWSRRRTSASRSTASRLRSTAAGPAGWTLRSSLAARLADKTPSCAAGDELAQHDMEPARGLGPQRHQAVVAVDQQADHRVVVLDADRAQPTMPQPGDGSRQRIVAVVLGGLGRAQQPDPRRQRRRNVYNLLAGANQLLRQQFAQPAGRLDRPGPFAAE
jgi:hypothetical protein